MAKLYVTEYAELAWGPAGRVTQVQLEPPLAEQAITIGSTSTGCAKFNSSTKIVRLHSDVICSVLLGTGAGADTAATTNSGRMVAGQTEYRGVPKGMSYLVSVVTNT